MPLCNRQLRDVNPSDILNDGLFRRCDTYKGGGGYDQFPDICEKRLGKRYHKQFIVQLYGCTLQCPYCYVTFEGIWGEALERSTKGLIEAFNQSGQDVFHLMGGSPASYIDQWYAIVEDLPRGKVFHSDLMLVERPYKPNILKRLATSNSLYAVNIKGVTKEDFLSNTGVDQSALLWPNLDQVVKSGINFYLTFTNPDMRYLDEFKQWLTDKYGYTILNDHFIIPLINYEATKKE